MAKLLEASRISRTTLEKCFEKWPKQNFLQSTKQIKREYYDAMEAIKVIQSKINTLEDKLQRFAARANKTQEETPTTESSRTLRIAEYDIHVLSSEVERECLIGLGRSVRTP